MSLAWGLLRVCMCVRTQPHGRVTRAHASARAPGGPGGIRPQFCGKREWRKTVLPAYFRIECIFASVLLQHAHDLQPGNPISRVAQLGCEVASPQPPFDQIEGLALFDAVIFAHLIG